MPPDSMQNAESINPQTSLTLQSLVDARHAFQNVRSANTRGQSDFFGQRLSNRRGQGVEFVDLRQYTAGDDIRHIDWNVTARSNEPYTRLYREEREHTITVAVDFRSSMFSGSNCLRAVRAGKLAASVLWRASDTGSRCSAVVQTHSGQQFSRPLAGQKGVLQACELIANEFARELARELARASQSNQQSNPPLSNLLSTINQPKRQSDSWFVLSGFDTNDDNQWRNQLSVSGHIGRMVGILILDPLEANSLPRGSYPFRNNTSVGNAIVNGGNHATLKNTLHNSIDQQIDQFDRAGIPLLVHNTNDSEVSVLARLQQRSLL